MLISIIVPSYNVEKYLLRCLDSINNQSFQDYEVILVNDGSTDSTGDICEQYCRKHPKFRVIHKHNEGLGYARNTGLDYAKGKYICFIDSDDYIEKDMLKNLYECLKANNADTCIGGFKRVFSNRTEEHTNPLAGKVFNKDNIKDEILVRMLGKRSNGADNLEMSVWKILFSNKIIKENNIRFPSERVYISEDIVFDLEYYSKAKCVCMSDFNGYCYCDNEGTLTTKYNSERYKKQKFLYDYLCKRTKELGIYNDSKERMMTTLIAIARYSIQLEVKFMGKNGKSHAENKIKEICYDDELNKIFSVYNNKAVPFKYRMMNNMIKNKNIKLLMFLWSLKFRKKGNSYD